jgi:hypothetical protein
MHRECQRSDLEVCSQPRRSSSRNARLCIGVRDYRQPLVVFTKRLREGVRRGRIRCSVRIWERPHVKVGGRYPMDDGHIVVDSIARLALKEITEDLARESGFDSVTDLLKVAKHGRGRNVYLIRFHYLRPGAWDTVPQPS